MKLTTHHHHMCQIVVPLYTNLEFRYFTEIQIVRFDIQSECFSARLN